MNDHDLQQQIQKNVLERLQRGNIPMRSRAYFIGRVALVTAVSLLTLAFSAYLWSFIAFSIHESGEQFLLGFGGRGVQTFFMLFPWLPTILDIALIAFLGWLLQGFKFGYRTALLVLFGIVLFVSAVVAAAISSTPLNGALLKLADRGDLPVIGNVYEDIRSSHHDTGVFRGSILSISGGEITITHDDNDHDADDGTWSVVLPPGYATSTLSVGERVYVLGTPSGPTVKADGMEELSPDQ